MSNPFDKPPPPNQQSVTNYFAPKPKLEHPPVPKPYVPDATHVTASAEAPTMSSGSTDDMNFEEALTHAVDQMMNDDDHLSEVDRAPEWTEPCATMDPTLASTPAKTEPEAATADTATSSQQAEPVPAIPLSQRCETDGLVHVQKYKFDWERDLWCAIAEEDLTSLVCIAGDLCLTFAADGSLLPANPQENMFPLEIWRRTSAHARDMIAISETKAKASAAGEAPAPPAPSVSCTHAAETMAPTSVSAATSASCPHAAETVAPAPASPVPACPAPASTAPPSPALLPAHVDSAETMSKQDADSKPAEIMQTNNTISPEKETMPPETNPSQVATAIAEAEASPARTGDMPHYIDTLITKCKQHSLFAEFLAHKQLTESSFGDRSQGKAVDHVCEFDDFVREKGEPPISCVVSVVHEFRRRLNRITRSDSDAESHRDQDQDEDANMEMDAAESDHAKASTWYYCFNYFF